MERPAGWRRNRNAPLPHNYMSDVVHDECVMINLAYPFEEGWREGVTEVIENVLIPIFENDHRGHLRYSDRYEEWVYFPEENSYLHMPTNEILYRNR